MNAKEAKAIKNKYEAVIELIDKTGTLAIHTPYPAIESFSTITDKDILSDIRTMLHLKCGALSRIIGEAEEKAATNKKDRDELAAIIMRGRVNDPKDITVYGSLPI